MNDEQLRSVFESLMARREDIPSVFGSFRQFAADAYPPPQRDRLLESVQQRVAAGQLPPKLPLAPGINLRWSLPDGSQQAWFVTVRDDDDPAGEAFFTIRVKPETAGLLAVWAIHLQRIKVPAVGAPTES